LLCANLSRHGWTYLSRDALLRGERQFSVAGEGVRDEIGFLIIHQRYADCFFPGTSVLHTRLRYALFVPWIYQTPCDDGSRRPPAPLDAKGRSGACQPSEKHQRGQHGGSS
jgi:hypothetical protein